MLTNTMNEKEVIKELEEDYQNVKKSCINFTRKIRRIILNTAKFPLIVNRSLKTAKKNRWLTTWIIPSKQYLKKYLISINCLLESKKGVYAYHVFFLNGEFVIHIYTPHFFSRYNQRMKLSLTGEDLIIHYFNNNSSYINNYKKENINKKKYKLHTYFSTQEGIALGYETVNPRVTLLKTFITYDMTKGDQIDLFKDSKEITKRKGKYIHDYKNTVMKPYCKEKEKKIEPNIIKEIISKLHSDNTVEKIIIK